MSKLTTDPKVKEAVANVRKADKGPDYFVVFKFTGGAGCNLEVAAEGAGGWDEASKLLDEKDGAYVLLRKDHKVELAKTLKFAFIDWFPGGLKLKRRSELSAMKKPVVDLLKPFHVELSASELRDVDQKTIDARIGAVSGTASHVKGKDAPSSAAAAAPAAVAPAADAAPAAAAPAEAPKEADAAAPAPAPKPEAKKAPVASKPVSRPVASGNSGLSFTNKPEFDAAIKAIRDDKTDTNWIVVTYSDRDTLTLAGSGADGFAGMMAKIDEAAISFGLLRVIELIDGKSKTTKFIYVKFVPDTAKPMKRAEVTTRAGSIEKAIGQYHVQFDITKKAELSEEQALRKLGQASGSASSVVAKK